ncbi:MAG TPA: hypothetical protein VGD72_01630 [Mycobacteriales bacterium]
MSCGLCAGSELAAPPVERGDWAVGVLRGYEVPGWLAMYPRRHVASADALTDAEAATLGAELRALTRALRPPGGKVYSVSFGERLPHWHVLVMAVPADLPPELRGAALLGAREALRDDRAAYARLSSLDTSSPSDRSDEKSR